MSHELVPFENGTYSVRPLDSEAMHSHIGPWNEAQTIYVGPSRLAERLQIAGPPLVLLDLGMGIATNALASIDCFERCRPQRDLHIISIENDLGGAKLALEHAARFDWLTAWNEAVQTLLDRRHWASGSGQSSIRWDLVEEDFFETAPTAPAEIVYFDFYSPRSNQALWGQRAFAHARTLCGPNATLHTYAASTAARAALLLAGFYVGAGPSTPAKRETTIASIRPEELVSPLQTDWLGKLLRSERPFPEDLAIGREQALKLLREHPQFLARSTSGTAVPVSCLSTSSGT